MLTNEQITRLIVDAYNIGKADGYQEGCAQGYDNAYNIGKADGYQQGYAQGYDDAMPEEEEKEEDDYM